ncbi:hypothetical protein PQ125_002654 [Salmonella enterica]|nr:hypothetical protein [Salmonella enterica]
MAKIIILNAPPGAGKDTIGKMISFYSPGEQCRIISFKEPMFDIALAILGKENYQRFMLAYDDREQKERPQTFLMGMSPREFMIWISEDVIKPKFGKDYFSVRFNQKVKECESPVVCTDGGFPDEVIALIESGHEVKMCRLHRRGYSFKNDSRDYIRLPIGWHGVNGYKEADFYLVDNRPNETVKSIIDLYLK